MKAAKVARNFCRGAVDAVLPPRCAVSGAIVDHPGMIAPSVWRGLRFIGDPLCPRCGVPFDFSVADAGEMVCTRCLTDPPAYASARAALTYDDASRPLILRFKHGDQIQAVHSFVPWLRRAGEGILEKADFLVPVPLHRWRLLRRRYNQAAIIAYALSKDCGVPCLPDALLRRRPTPVQGHLGHAERQKNVKGAFAVNPRHKGLLQGKTIVLIDDVLTTGATVGECTKALLAAGSKEVHVLAIARVVRGG